MPTRQSMRRVELSLDNAAAEAFFSSLEWKVLSRDEFDSVAPSRAFVIDWCDGFCNHQRRLGAADGPFRDRPSQPNGGT